MEAFFVETLHTIENLLRVLMWFITDAYFSFVFFVILSAKRLWYAVACGPHHPNVAYIRGVKVPFSTCIARTLYFLILTFSFCTSSCLGVVSRYDGDFGEQLAHHKMSSQRDSSDL